MAQLPHPPSGGTAGSLTDLLQVHNLRKDFADPHGGVRRVIAMDSFTLAPGEQAALEGSSGSGKTTFLHLLAGLVRPDAGRVVLEGVDVFSLSEARRDTLRARRMGIVYQGFHLLGGLTALENVLVAMAAAGRADSHHAEDLLGAVGLADRMEDRPAALSAGQQQRVALARALANRPALLLADEPTANLDPSASEGAVGLMRRLCREEGAALLLVSHDPRVLEGFDRREVLAPPPSTGAAAT